MPRGRSGVRILRVVTCPSSDSSASPAGTVDYLGSQLHAMKRHRSYERGSYALKSWQTYGEFLPTDRGARLLEIGPGDCEFAEHLHNVQGFKQISVIDTSPAAISAAQSFGVPADLVDDTQDYLQHRESRYDAVILLHVLEHIEKASIIPFLTAVRRSLRRGGRLLVEVPNMGDPLNGLYYRYGDFTHEVGFTEQSLQYVLHHAGFGQLHHLDKVGSSSRVGRTLQFAARRLLHGLLFVVNLPNGRQMRRRTGPVLAVVAEV